MVAKVDGTNGLLQAYDYQVLTTGFSYTFAAGTQLLLAVPAGTLATGTVTMPAAPADGMNITITSTQAITALTVNANTGQSIVGGGATQLTANTARVFVYRLSNTTWYLQSSVPLSGVTSAVAGNGITVSGATGAVTISQDIYTGTVVLNTSFPVGSYVLAGAGASVGNGPPPSMNQSKTLYVVGSNPTGVFFNVGAASVLAGTWRNRGAAAFDACGSPAGGLFQRTA